MHAHPVQGLASLRTLDYNNNNLVTDVHDATSEDRSETVLHDSQGGLARKERVLLGSPLPSM